MRPAPLAEARLPVLVVGAGPAGLTATAELAKRGVPVVCVDQQKRLSSLPRAVVFWPRALDIVSGLCGDTLLAERGLSIDDLHYYSGTAPIGHIRFRGPLRATTLPQSEVESSLAHHLALAGAPVRRATRLVALEHRPGAVAVMLHGATGPREELFSHVVAADGAGSTVRGLLGISFEGSTYADEFVLGDVRLDGPLQHRALHYFCSPRGVLVLIGLPHGRFRVFASLGQSPQGDRTTSLEQLQDIVDERGPGGLALRDVGWHGTVTLHTRHAQRYRDGRVFLVGDAAHIHSPAGGQGVNAAIIDAHNLAWKIALVHHGSAAPTLLDTYEAERRPAAEAVLRQAQLQTRLWMLSSPWQTRARDLMARIGSDCRLYDRSYVPWLAGLRTVYPTGTVQARPRTGPARRAARAFVPGALLPRLIVTDGPGGPGRPLHRALPDSGFTLLLTSHRPGPGMCPRTSAAVEALRGEFGPLVQVRLLDALGVLHTQPVPDPDMRRHARCLAVLVRPDHHVAAVRPPRDTAAIAAFLRSLTLAGPRPPHSSPTAGTGKHEVR
ncbi:FAD-dependent monooxygenase [Streptomyces sp. NPDC021093]|uniref:FAD-dependent monooxygenase n=1 Tax=Streptomyces sp. NPDC021093 TaxID=3365112 RepID=UPI0037898520